MTEATTTATPTAYLLTVRGIVQGVGFRPFVWRLATDCHVTGSVRNGCTGVEIRIEGEPTATASFIDRLPREAPPLSRIDSFEVESTLATRAESFTIEASNRASVVTIRPSVDLPICDACLAELFDPSDRRYRYPFLNCTNCGPRYSIIDHMPYDRTSTVMSSFELCSQCRNEYKSPSDRRYHAQPTACPACGPAAWLEGDEEPTTDTIDVVNHAAQLVLAGKILAVKGLGGFHLACDATNNDAVMRLRQRKRRPDKPLAIMVPSLEAARHLADINDAAASALLDSSRPIVVVPTRADNCLARSVAPGHDTVGIMIAYTPLHHLLLHDCGRALVMTSGNPAGAPICATNDEAREALGAIADCLLLHNRQIRRRCDDGIVLAAHVGAPTVVVRRARGSVPQRVSLPTATDVPRLAVGGQQKSTIAFAINDQAYLSTHLGDLDHPAARRWFDETIGDFGKLLNVTPAAVACDLHPDYASTRWAEQSGLPIERVQHHHAHFAGVLAEHGYRDRALGLMLDGTGWGTDGTIWGGELLCGDSADSTRVGWLRPFMLPGGETAIVEPWRMLVSVLHEADCYNAELFPAAVRNAARQLHDMIPQIRYPIRTSSTGRLWDAIGVLLTGRTRTTYDAQAAIELEQLAMAGTPTAEESSSAAVTGEIDWRPLVAELVSRYRRGEDRSQLARWWHDRFATLVVSAATAARSATGLSTIALSGGVMMNRLLVARLVGQLSKQSFAVLQHRAVPPNDGGLAYGQLVATIARSALCV